MLGFYEYVQDSNSGQQEVSPTEPYPQPLHTLIANHFAQWNVQRERGHSGFF